MFSTTSHAPQITSTQLVADILNTQHSQSLGGPTPEPSAEHSTGTNTSGDAPKVVPERHASDTVGGPDVQVPLARHSDESTLLAPLPQELKDAEMQLGDLKNSTAPAAHAALDGSESVRARLRRLEDELQEDTLPLNELVDIQQSLIRLLGRIGHRCSELV